MKAETKHRRLDVCLIGAQKAGSTSVFRWMEAHPALAHSRIKETHFWSEDRTPDEVDDWFDDQFAHATAAQLKVDASTSYSMAPEYDGVALRLHAHNPEMRFVYLVRDPVRRLESHLVHSYRNGLIDAADLSAARADPGYLDRSRYHFQLQRYLDLFPREQLLVVVFEELVADPLAGLSSIEEFLGVEGGSTSLPKMNVSAVRPGVTPFEMILRRRGIRLPHRVRQTLRRRWGRGEPSSVLDESGRRWVRSELRQDREALEALMGREMPWPSR